jgi:hypothetical protein
MLARSEQSGIAESGFGSQSHLAAPRPQRTLSPSCSASARHYPIRFLNLVLYDAASNTLRLHILESAAEVEHWSQQAIRRRQEVVHCDNIESKKTGRVARQ